MKLYKKRGFTLVELLAVVAIVAVLLLLALPQYIDSTKNVKIRVFESNMRDLITISNTERTSDPKMDVSQFKKTKREAENLEGKPKGAKYEIDEDWLVGTFDATQVGLTKKDDYIIKYNLVTEAIEEITTENMIAMGAGSLISNRK